MDVIAVSGGTYSGKTATIAALSAAGWPTVPEAAIEIIADLTARLGVEGQREWRRAHALEFQLAISRRQAEYEAAYRTPARGVSTGRVFCDRGLPDGIAYCRAAGMPVPAELLRLTAEHTYRRAFVLETLPAFEARSASGRTSTRAESAAMVPLLVEAYRPYAAEIVVLPAVGVQERVKMILARG